MSLRRVVTMLPAALIMVVLSACRGDDGVREDPQTGPIEIRQMLPRQARSDTQTFLVIHGAGFDEDVALTIGDRRISEVTFVNPELLAARVPPGLPAGPQPVQVSDSGRGNANAPFPLTVVGPPATPAPPTQPPATATATPPPPTATATPPPPTATATPPPTRPPTQAPTRPPTQAPTAPPTARPTAPPATQPPTQAPATVAPPTQAANPDSPFRRVLPADPPAPPAPR